VTGNTDRSPAPPQAGATASPEAGLSRLSHRLIGQHRAQADSLSLRRILTRGYGFWRTGRTRGIDLRTCECRSGGTEWTAARIRVGGLGDSLLTWPRSCVHLV
jgi:hypothetical protein